MPDDDELTAAAEAHFKSALIDEPPAETDPEPASTDDGLPLSSVEAPPDAPAEPTEAAVDAWEFDDGLRITRDQAKAYAEFEAFLADNPELAEAIGGTVTGTHRFVPVDTPAPQASAPTTTPATDFSAPPSELDMEDPVQRTVWERMVATQQKLDEATAALTRHEQVIQRQQSDTTASLVNRATQSYQEAHKLTDEDMDEIQRVTARLNVVPALMAPVDPITGLPRQVDPLKALEAGFDLAHWQIPRLRDRELADVQSQTRDANKRKAKLSSLGGSSGSVPRQPNTVPTNPQERRQAMIAEMATMLNGNWIQPEDS
jgi:hypothetical protein